MLDVAEQGHPDDRVDEGDQRQQRSDVEERRKGHDEREQQFPDSFGGFDESQDSADSEDSDDSEEGRRNREIFHHVLHHDADDGSNHLSD